MSKVMIIERRWDCPDYLPVSDACMAHPLEIVRGCGKKKKIPDWCPLPDLPEKLLAWHDEWHDYARDWNDCLKKALKRGPDA